MAKSRRPSQPFEPSPSRRYFERFPHDPRFRHPPEFIERIGFMADPKEWLVPTSIRKPVEVADMVSEMWEKGLVRITIDKNKRTRVTPTPLTRGLHFLTRYCLHPKPFGRLPEKIRLDLVKVYLATLIRSQDYNPATRKYNSAQPISQARINLRIRHDGDINRINKGFRSFGKPENWDEHTKKYYHYLIQKAAIASAADEYLTQKRWDALMELRSHSKLRELFPKFPWGKVNEP